MVDQRAGLSKKDQGAARDREGDQFHIDAPVISRTDCRYMGSPGWSSTGKFMRVLEYHVPKLAKSEVSVELGVEESLSNLSIEQLQAILAEEDGKARALLGLPDRAAIEIPPDVR
jgi:hypothetical protein